MGREGDAERVAMAGEFGEVRWPRFTSEPMCCTGTSFLGVSDCGFCLHAVPASLPAAGATADWPQAGGTRTDGERARTDVGEYICRNPLTFFGQMDK